ncbi:hypothetical protein KKF91_09405 [Myxococcota bacterium]|nr:hypothetical protein [Myxococcota bacterium]MBU1430758.1 hypothetical protein [Myxococcota bacterium]MBU1896497.1 hypothetical protein [Myxococcota bacterium]
MRRSPSLTLTLLLMGCGASVYAPGLNAGFDPEPDFEISDDDIGKAFAARPQLKAESQVAFYTFDQARAQEIEETLKATKGVRAVYSLPPLLVEGQRALHNDPYAWRREPPKFSMKKLRLLAARARCDLLVIFDKQHSTSYDVNGWIAVVPLVLPILFVPYLDLEVESHLDAYVFDVRNGYLYGHIQVNERDAVDYLTIWGTAAEAEYVEAQWTRLKAQVKASLEGLLSDTALHATPAP